MSVLNLIFVTSLTVALAIAVNNGPVKIMVNGQAQTKYVLSGDESKSFVQVNGDSIALSGGGRVYLGDNETISPNSFYKMQLLGKRLTFDVNIDKVGCNCNGALYFVTMPGYNAEQKPASGNNSEYYCDACAHGKIHCPEIDVMEANKYAMASTAHDCQYTAPHYYPSCDSRGCGTNVLDVNISGFGPDKYIDTNNQFTLSVSFITGSNGMLSTVKNNLSQKSKSLQFDACNPGYLQWMGLSLSGIVMTASLRGLPNGGMSWLDGKSGCQGGCNIKESSVTFSNIRLDSM